MSPQRSRRDSIRVEILGPDAGYLRPSNGAFAVRVARLTLSLPAR